MSNDNTVTERSFRPVLEYPCGDAPAPGDSVVVAPGVRWIRMPMPGPLNHINLWSLDDICGYTLVDSGMRTDEIQQAWRKLFSRGDSEATVSRILITHMHPDHVGMAGWLAGKFGCRLWMTRQEYLYCRVLMSDTGRTAPEQALQFFRRAGWGIEALESYQARFGNFGRHIHALPDSFRRLIDGEEFDIGGSTWQVIVGTGHSPEHACFYCAEKKVLISGDQVLPKISSNVSVHPTEPDSNPMQDWLDSLRRFKVLVPDDVLVLPSHNEPFRGLHARLSYLEASQLRAIDRLKSRLTRPMRIIDLFISLFGRDIEQTNAVQLGLATGEALACVNYLVHRQEVAFQTDHDGVNWYSTV
jgi:glyoxylase-like metal-dependent hydrolase (beta-lactamase superfamily II)